MGAPSEIGGERGSGLDPGKKGRLGRAARGAMETLSIV